MKYATIIFSLLIIPNVLFAAQLTNDQATSLIAVVQSSPETPASAFTSLITAFSSITVPQAESLISVIQASPNTIPTAFVSMLLAFTVDPIIIPTPPVVESPVIIGSAVDNTPAVTTPVVESVVMDTTPPIVSPFDIVSDLAGNIFLRIYADEEINLGKTTLSKGTITDKDHPSGSGLEKDNWGLICQKDRWHANTVYGYEPVIEGVSIGDEVVVTVQDMAGNQVTNTITVK